MSAKQRFAPPQSRYDRRTDKNSLKKRIPISYLKVLQDRSSGERGAVREFPYAIDPSHQLDRIPK